MASPWKKITNTPPFSVDTMPLLTDGSALNPVTPPSNAPNTLTFNCRFLLLPTGQVLYSNCTSDLQVFTPTGLPHSHWRPHISHVPRTLRRGHSYRVRGRQLNGMSQASGYGDDAQMASNYPLVRLRHSNQVHFCRTYDHSTMAVATGKKWFIPTSTYPTPLRLVTTNSWSSRMASRQSPSRFT